MSSVACGTDDVDAEDFAVLRVGDDLDEAVVAVDDGGLGVAGEGEFADLDLVALLLGLGFGEADRCRSADRSRCSRGCGRGGRDGAYWPAIFDDGDDAAHGADVGQLRQSRDDVADGVDAGLGGLLHFVDLDEAAIEFDLGLVEADVGGARGAADGDEDLLGFLFRWLAVSGRSRRP